MRARFGQDYIRREFDRIGDALSEPLTLYQIGGGAMAFQDLKDATKDIDVIVRSSGDLGQLQKVVNIPSLPFGLAPSRLREELFSVVSGLLIQP